MISLPRDLGDDGSSGLEPVAEWFVIDDLRDVPFDLGIGPAK